MQSWTASFRLLHPLQYVTAANPITNFTLVINLVDSDMMLYIYHMGIKGHNTFKGIELESLEFWGEINGKIKLKQLDKAEFRAATHLPVGHLIPTLI